MVSCAGNSFSHSSIITFPHSFIQGFFIKDAIDVRCCFRHWGLKSKCTPFGDTPGILCAGVKGTPRVTMNSLYQFLALRPSLSFSCLPVASLFRRLFPLQRVAPCCKGIKPFLSHLDSLVCRASKKSLWKRLLLSQLGHRNLASYPQAAVGAAVDLVVTSEQLSALPTLPELASRSHRSDASIGGGSLSALLEESCPGGQPARPWSTPVLSPPALQRQVASRFCGFFSFMNLPPWCVDVFSHLSRQQRSTPCIKYRILHLPSSRRLSLTLPLLVSTTFVPLCHPVFPHLPEF